MFFSSSINSSKNIQFSVFSSIKLETSVNFIELSIIVFISPWFVENVNTNKFLISFEFAVPSVFKLKVIFLFIFSSSIKLYIVFILVFALFSTLFNSIEKPLFLFSFLYK